MLATHFVTAIYLPVSLLHRVCAWGWLMQAEILPLFLVCISLYPMCIWICLCSVTIPHKKTGKTPVSICWMCRVRFHDDSNREVLQSLFYSCDCDAVFAVFLTANHTQASANLRNVHLLWIWGSQHTYSTYRHKKAIWCLFWGSCWTHDHIGQISAI